MKYLGVGLSRTGTTSLYKSLNILGIKCIHWTPERLRDVIMGKSKNFKKYDDVEAVTDIPAAFFYKELKNAYPNCKFILTIRDENSWFKSVKNHYESINYKMKNFKNKDLLLTESKITQKLVYGSENVLENLYKENFNNHNNKIIKEYKEELLIMDIIGGDGWEKLCPFVNKPIPKISFPKLNIKKNL